MTLNYKQKENLSCGIWSREFVVSVEVIHEVAAAYGSPISLSRSYSTTNVSSIERLPNVADSTTLQCMCHDFGVVNADRQCYPYELALAEASLSLYMYIYCIPRQYRLQCAHIIGFMPAECIK